MTKLENLETNPTSLDWGVSAASLLNMACDKMSALALPRNVRKAITSRIRKGTTYASASGNFEDGNRKYKISYVRDACKTDDPRNTVIGIKERLNIRRIEMGESEILQEFTIRMESTEKGIIGSISFYNSEEGKGMSITDNDQKTEWAIRCFLASV